MIWPFKKQGLIKPAARLRHLLSPIIVTREFIMLCNFEGFSGRPPIKDDTWDLLFVEASMKTSDLSLSLDNYSDKILLPIISTLVKKIDPGEVIVYGEFETGITTLPHGYESYNGISVAWVEWPVPHDLKLYFRIYR